MASTFEISNILKSVILKTTKLSANSPVWTPDNQWTKDNWKDWRIPEDVRCVDCGEEYPEDHDGEGFVNGHWYCCWCWDDHFLYEKKEKID